MTDLTYHPDEVARICQMLADACDRRLALGWLVLPKPTQDRSDCCCPLGAAMDPDRPPGPDYIPSTDPYFERPIAEDAHILGLDYIVALAFIRGFEISNPPSHIFTETNRLFYEIGCRFRIWYQAATLEQILEPQRLLIEDP